jgi:hypothetical protein
MRSEISVTDSFILMKIKTDNVRLDVSLTVISTMNRGKHFFLKIAVCSVHEHEEEYEWGVNVRMIWIQGEK